jgi:hypothetical protein
MDTAIIVALITAVGVVVAAIITIVPHLLQTRSKQAALSKSREPRYFVLACVWEGTTYYGVASRRDFTQFLNKVIDGTVKDLGNHYWQIGEAANGDTSKVCGAFKAMSEKCPKTLKATYEGKNGTTVDYLVSETDKGLAKRLLAKLGEDA